MNILTRLYIMRHAEACPPKLGQRDITRQLSKTGISEAHAISQHFGDTLKLPDLILCSSSTRTQETAAALALSPQPAIETSHALYEGDDQDYLDLIKQYDVSILLLIGHNPTVHYLLKLLTNPAISTTDIPPTYPTAGLSVLEFSCPLKDITAQSGKLSTFYLANHP